ncbi:MAG: DUF4296 domain-containing protein [Bacteroidetes bacterium]|jgi:hypothetical protein|nr:DUF4296 domain-containing protein [Bacteroidota bacterium]
MKTQPLLIFLLATLIMACQEETQPLPLDEAQLIEVLADVHIAEAAGQQLRGATKDSVMQVYYAQVCSIHQVDQAAFVQSMEQLRNEPERLQNIYDKVTEAIERVDAKTQ